MTYLTRGEYIPNALDPLETGMPGGQWTKDVTDDLLELGERVETRLWTENTAFLHKWERAGIIRDEALDAYDLAISAFCPGLANSDVADKECDFCQKGMRRSESLGLCNRCKVEKLALLLLLGRGVQAGYFG